MSSDKRLLIISRKYPPSTGGMQTYAFELVSRLSKKFDTRTILLGLEQGHLIWFLPYAFFKALCLATCKRYDVLYLCDGLLAPLGSLIKFFTGVKVIVTVHGLDITYKNPVYSMIVPRSVAGSDKVVCVSNNTLEECVKRGVPRNICVFIPNGVNSAVFMKGNVPEKRKEKRKVLLSVGRLVPRKGIAPFIADVVSELDGVYLYLVAGEGPEKNRIIRTIRENRLEDRVRLLGKVDDHTLKDLYRTSDVLVMPNLYNEGDPEGFGIVVIEAASCGLPVLAYNVDGIGDAVLEGRTGWLIKEGDTEGFLRRIKDIGLAKENVRFENEVFDWKNIIERYTEEIGNVLERSGVNIFSVTMTPVRPPFDDGPKNIVYGVAKRSPGNRFCFISSFCRGFPKIDNIRLIRSPFQSGKHHSMPFVQKIFVFGAMLFNMRWTDIFQFFFTPKKYFSCIFGWIMRKTGKRSVQVVSSVHTLLRENEGKDLGRLFFGDIIVTQTDYARERLVGEGILNTVRIYPGIDMKRYDPSDAGKRRPAFLDEGYRYILYPGNYTLLEEVYSMRDLCRIVREVCERNEDVRFVMACRIRSGSDVSAEKKFKIIARDEGVEDRFIYLNTVDDMPSLMVSCAAGILPARKEMARILEIPLVILEMSALGKPFIAGNVRPLEEVKDKGIGVFPRGVDPGSYAQVLNGLLEDVDLSGRLGAASREAVEKYFDLDNSAKEYNRIYESLRR